MSFSRYPTYNDSGVEWLGEVPAEWEVGPLKRLGLTVESGTSVNAIDEQAVEGWPGVLKTSCVYSGAFDPAENKAVVREEHERVTCPVRLGSLIVSRMNTPDLVGAAGFVHSVPGNLFLPDRLWQISFSRADARFVHYWTITAIYRAFVEAACTGTSASMKNLGQDQLLAFAFASPTLPEQKAIVAFLDRHTARIDALIAEQRRLSDLLNEKRQAVISNAVTKGLNPDAPIRPSGIEWLGNVPEHWKVERLKRHLEFVTSGSRGWAENYSDSGELFLRIGNLTRDRIDLDLSDVQRVAVPAGSEEERTKVQSGDVVFSITAALGSVAVVPKDLETAYVSQHLALARLRRGRLEPRWLAFVALSIVGRTWFEMSSYGGTKIQLSLDDVRDLPVPFPDVLEQAAIVDFIDRQLKLFDGLAAEARSSIHLLQERRRALISAAVTGQIDVRREHETA